MMVISKRANKLELWIFTVIMSKEEAVYKALLQIQRKHMMYFLQNNTDVYQCVQIVLEPLALPILNTTCRTR